MCNICPYHACLDEPVEGMTTLVRTRSSILRMELHTEPNLARQSNIEPIDCHKGHEDRRYGVHFMAVLQQM